jgi:hypothetical protein
MPAPKDYRPLNPWGRPMPKAERNPLHTELWGVVVETRGGSPLRVGPAVAKPIAEELLAAINLQIAKGAELAWSNPSLVKVSGPPAVNERERDAFLNGHASELIIPMSTLM